MLLAESPSPSMPMKLAVPFSVFRVVQLRSPSDSLTNARAKSASSEAEAKGVVCPAVEPDEGIDPEAAEGQEVDIDDGLVRKGDLAGVFFKREPATEADEVIEVDLEVGAELEDLPLRSIRRKRDGIGRPVVTSKFFDLKSTKLPSEVAARLISTVTMSALRLIPGMPTNSALPAVA